MSLFIPDNIDKLIEPTYRAIKAPAIGAAVISNYRLAALGAIGVRQLESEAPVTSIDKWHLGSCGKAMTATLLGRLAQCNYLPLETPVGPFFRELIDNKVNDEWDHATLWQLLTHSAGVPSDNTLGPLLERDDTPTSIRMSLAKDTLSRAPDSKPGTEYKYSNKGYVMAGLMAEIATGKTYEELMHEEVFEPLDMKSSGFGAPDGEQPWGHNGKIPIAPSSEDADNQPWLSPAGRIHSSLADWSNFVITHMERESSGFLSPSMRSQLHVPGPGKGEQYAAGWLVADRSWAKKSGSSGKVLMHEGSNGRFTSLIWLAPEIGFATLLTANTGFVGKDLDRLTGTLVNEYLSHRP